MYNEDLDPTGEGADAMYDSARDKAHEAGFRTVGEYLDEADAVDEQQREGDE